MPDVIPPADSPPVPAKVGRPRKGNRVVPKTHHALKRKANRVLPRPKSVKVKPAKKKELPIEEKMMLLEYFPELFLGERVYPWQFNVLQALGFKESRVALKAANGSGKTSAIIASAVLWHMIRFPGAPVVCTAGVYRQVADVLWPILRQKIIGLGGEAMGWKVTENRIEYIAPSLEGHPPNPPSVCYGFSADRPESAESQHRRGPSDNLLYIVDEAKAVQDGIFDAVERCQPSRVLEVSSPGARAGRFYERFAKRDPRYDLFTVTAYDCPHIKPEWIKEQIETYGEKSPLVQSMIFAEFGDEDTHSLVLPPLVLQNALSSPPAKLGHDLRVGCDFAAGGDENVIVVLEGNAVKERISWREKDTMAAVGRFITELKRIGVKQENVWADGSGIGIPMCDALREAGWYVNRVNNGEAAHDDQKFANRGTEMWVQFARLVETGKIIVPADDEILHRQLTTRRLEHNSRGKLIVEAKDKMKKRGLESPDRADAIVLAAVGGGMAAAGFGAKYTRGLSLSDLEDDEHSTMAGAFAG